MENTTIIINNLKALLTYTPELGVTCVYLSHNTLSNDYLMKLMKNYWNNTNLFLEEGELFSEVVKPQITDKLIFQYDLPTTEKVINGCFKMLNDYL